MNFTVHAKFEQKYKLLDVFELKLIESPTYSITKTSYYLHIPRENNSDLNSNQYN